MQTTREQLDATVLELKTLLASTEGRTMTPKEHDDMVNKTGRVAALRNTFDADQLRKRAPFKYSDGGDAVDLNSPTRKSASVDTSGADLAPISFDNATLKALHGAVTTRTVATKAALTTAQVPQGDIPTYERAPWPGLREMTRILDLIPAETTEGSTVHTFRATTLASAAATVAPGGVKPESTPAWEEVVTNVRKIAHWSSVVDEIIADYSSFFDVIGTEMIAGLVHTENAQLLVGDGLGTNLLGMVPAAIAAGSTIGSAGTDLDAVVAAMTRIRTTAFVEPDTIILHPGDWGSAGFATAKDTQGNYLLGDAVTSPQPMLWGMRVVLTTQMTENSALVGNFARAAKVWVREGVRLDVAPASGAEFKNNTTLIRCEERIAMEVLRPEALCVVTAV